MLNDRRDRDGVAVAAVLVTAELALGRLFDVVGALAVAPLLALVLDDLTAEAIPVVLTIMDESPPSTVGDDDDDDDVAVVVVDVVVAENSDG